MTCSTVSAGCLRSMSRSSKPRATFGALIVSNHWVVRWFFVLGRIEDLSLGITEKHRFRNARLLVLGVPRYDLFNWSVWGMFFSNITLMALAGGHTAYNSYSPLAYRTGKLSKQWLIYGGFQATKSQEFSRPTTSFDHQRATTSLGSL